MNRIGIIFAMYEELEAMLKLVKLNKVNKIYDLDFYECTINDKECILVESGVGKVNASRSTQVLIDNYSPNYILNVGVAGGIDNKLNVCDIVVSDKLVQYDFDITAFGHEKGFISNVGQYVESDEQLIVKIEKIIKRINDKDFNIKVGTIASGDIFCTESKMKEKIRNKFNADCIEMEGSAIAQVCKLDKIPFLVVRSISDKPNGQNEITFDKFLEKASRRCAYIINEFFTHQ